METTYSLKTSMRAVHDRVRKLSVFFLLPLWLFIFIAELHAQSFNEGIIRGSIIDEQKLPVPFATVILRKTKDSTVYKSAFSDEQGAFAFNQVLGGMYFLEVKLISFETVTRRDLQVSESNPEINLGVLTFLPSSVSLKAATVKAEIPFIERKIDKTVVNVQNSIISTGSSVLEVMEKLPGVQVRQDGQITLNGKAGVTVFIDGKATLLSSEDLANLLRGMSSAGVQKIEIMAKPSAKYDAAGTGGIINIVKKKNRREGLNGSINAGYGQGRRSKYNGSADLSFKGKKFNLFTNHAYQHNRIVRESHSNIVFFNDSNRKDELISSNLENRATQVYTPSLGIDYYFSEKTTLSLSGSGLVRHFDSNTDSHTDELDGSKNKTNTHDFINNSGDESFNYSSNLHLVHQLDTLGRELSADLDYSDYWNNSIQENENVLRDASGNFMGLSSWMFDQRGKLNIYSGKIDYLHPLKGMRLETGLKSSLVESKSDNDFYLRSGGLNGMDSSLSNYFRYSENINAAYLNINKEYKKIAFQFGLRAEHTLGTGRQLITGQVNKQNFIQLFPSIFSEYKINEDHGLNLQLGRRIDRPAYAEKNPLRRMLNFFYYTQGDPDLRPQFSYSNALTYSYQDKFSMTLDYTLLKDYLTKSSFPEADQRITGTRPINIASSYIYNLDMIYSTKLNTWWTTNNNLFVFYQVFKGRVNDFVLNNQGIPSFYLNTNNSFSVSDKTSAEFTFWYEHTYREGFTVFKPMYSLSLGVKRMFFDHRASLVIGINDVFWTEPYNWNTDLPRMDETWIAKNDTRVLKINFTYRFGGKNMKRVIMNTGAEEEKRRATSKDN